MTWLQPGGKDFVAPAPGDWQRCSRAAAPGVRTRNAALPLGLLLVIPLALAVGGCFLVPWSPDRPAPTAFSSLPVYVEGCETCHAADVSRTYWASPHGARGIRCGQCHLAGEHPDFTQPVADASCGGCHQAEYQQTVASRHFATRVRRSLDTDRAARVALRRARFVVSTGGSGRFAGDAIAGELGGRLCAACHYDEHRLGRDGAKRADVCTGCHAGRDEHYPIVPAGGTNRCSPCHVRVGETVAGLIVNTHRFAVPGTDGSEP